MCLINNSGTKRTDTTNNSKNEKPKNSNSGISKEKGKNLIKEVGQSVAKEKKEEVAYKPFFIISKKPTTLNPKVLDLLCKQLYSAMLHFVNNDTVLKERPVLKIKKNEKQKNPIWVNSTLQFEVLQIKRTDILSILSNEIDYTDKMEFMKIMIVNEMADELSKNTRTKTMNSWYFEIINDFGTYETYHTCLVLALYVFRAKLKEKKTNNNERKKTQKDKNKSYTKIKKKYKRLQARKIIT